MMNSLEFGKLIALAIQLLIKRSQLDDTERKEVAELHEEWTQKAYGSNEYVRYGTTPAGRAQLWRSTRNVAASSPAPDVPTNPQNWVKL